VKFADLHLHTLYSDGTYSPESLVHEAVNSGFSCIAVVDHDTVEGVEETIQAGLKVGLEVLSGIELTAEYDGVEVHLLGYFIDHRSLLLKEELLRLKKIRVERVYKIIERLKVMGVSLKAHTVFELGGKGTVGRLHIARAMVKEGIVSTTAEAFANFIGDNCPAYVCGFRFTPQEAIALIKNVGGLAVLAHPYSLHRDALIPELVKSGLLGLEVYYPEHTQSTINFYSQIARQYNLLVTGGSGCHGTAKPEVRLGMIKLPYDYVERLKEKHLSIIDHKVNEK